MTVYLTVGGQDDGTTLIKSYANRELRALGDVVVWNGAPPVPQASTEYRLNLVVLPTPGGYAISVVVQQLNTTRHLLKQFLEDKKISPEIVSAALSMVDDSSIVEGHSLRTCPSSGLEAEIKELVAKFDVEYLQPRRAFWQLHMNSPKTPKQN